MENRVFVLKFSDFGPPSISFDILGQEWWQWEPHGHYELGKQPDVKVVEYRNISLEKVKKAYTIIKEKLQDYRYLEYSRALAFLDHELKYLREWIQRDPDSYLLALMARLKETREDIVSHLAK